jgi:hypothetical protein
VTKKRTLVLTQGIVTPQTRRILMPPPCDLPIPSSCEAGRLGHGISSIRWRLYQDAPHKRGAQLTSMSVGCLALSMG